MRAGGAAEVRTLEVHAGDRRHGRTGRGGARRRGAGAVHRRSDPGERGGISLGRRGDERRAPRRDAVVEQRCIELGPVGAVRGGDVDAVDAVHLEVDEPRDEHHRRHIGVVGERVDGSDEAVAHVHGRRTQPPSGGAHPRRPHLRHRTDATPGVESPSGDRAGPVPSAGWWTSQPVLRHRRARPGRTPTPTSARATRSCSRPTTASPTRATTARR